MKLCKNIIGLSFIFILSITTTASADNKSGARSDISKAKTVDHSQLEILKQPFKNGKELTNACLSCHNLADQQFRKTLHWTWQDDTGEKKNYGKMHDSLNNFCISTNKGNDNSCLDCHTGWGRDTEAINCLNCHIDSNYNFEESLNDIKMFIDSGDEESLEMASEIQTEVGENLKKIGMPTRKNCGSCHFYGGGGDGVKHGDLDSSMAEPDKNLDVHMGGKNFTCVRCHTTHEHHISGRVYTKPASTSDKSLIDDDELSKISCTSCHTSQPHTNDKINDHTDVVACQTCHIPSFAREKPTKMAWDWSQAGKMKDGKPYSTEDKFGEHDYLSIKGKFVWDKNVIPEYEWYNGTITSITENDAITPGGKVAVSAPEGSVLDKRSKIHPFKIHKGKQPYDTETNKLLTPLLSGDHGYWKTFNWIDSLSRGASFSGTTFSGKFDFIDTTYALPITHMVAPKENAVRCNECHTRNNGRMAKISGLYLPGRDYSNRIDIFAWVCITITLIVIFIHAGIRILFTFFFNHNHPTS